MKKIFALNLYGPGLGDLVAGIATPIARLMHAPCIDPETKQLRPAGGCAKRKAFLNAAMPQINPLRGAKLLAAVAAFRRRGLPAVENPAKVAGPTAPNP